MERRGLTLPEILVVITILLIIIGLSFPIMAAAKRQALISVSTSNLHQLSLAHALYVEDNLDTEPENLKNVLSYVKSAGIWKSPLDDADGLNRKASQDFKFPVSYFWANDFRRVFGDQLRQTAVFVDVATGEKSDLYPNGELAAFSGLVLRGNRDGSVSRVFVPLFCASFGTSGISGRPFWKVFTDVHCPPNVCPPELTPCP